MSRWVMDVMQSGGYFGLVFLMVLENVFPPIPSELILPLAGYMASQDELNLWGVVAAGTLGSVLGALPLYWVGRKYGQERLCRFAGKHGRWLALSPDDITRASRWFDRYGLWTVFLCRLIPGLRSLISIPAGIRRMPMATFLACTALGTALWSALLALAGWWLGNNFDQVSKWLDPVVYIVLGTIVLAYLWRVWKHRGDSSAQPSDRPS